MKNIHVLSSPSSVRLQYSSYGGGAEPYQSWVWSLTPVDARQLAAELLEAADSADAAGEGRVQP